MAKDKRTSVYFDREKLEFVGLDEPHIKQLKQTYKNIDIESELSKMGLWLISSKGVKRKGNIGFILNWLNNASCVSAAPEQSDSIEQDSPLRALLNDIYLKELWKGREHILEMNKKKN